MRAIVNTQRALRADPTLATQVGQRLFPAEEAALIAELIARDADFYDPAISEESVRLATKFAQELGLLSGPVAYEDIVATQFASLWSQ